MQDLVKFVWQNMMKKTNGLSHMQNVSGTEAPDVDGVKTLIFTNITAGTTFCAQKAELDTVTVLRWGVRKISGGIVKRIRKG